MTTKITDDLIPLIEKRLDCKHENSDDYGDGMCYEGCCNRYQCNDCGKIWTEEVAG